GTTNAQGGAAFSSTSFGLDGGRALQLGGTSTASGSSAFINLNATNPNTGTSDPGSGTLTILSGATLIDQTTSVNDAFDVFASNRGGSDTGAAALMINQGTLQKTGTGQSFIEVAFNNSGLVDVQNGILRLSGGGIDVGGTYQGAGTLNFSGGTHTLD